MADSSQKFIARNRAPRVQIEYDVELYGAQKKVQLPFVMGVLSDLSGKSTAETPAVSDRKFLEIDVDNFDDRMKAMAPRVEFSVSNTLTGEGNLAVDLTFEKMADFNPAQIAAKIEPLRKLLEARTQLSTLMAYMDGKAGAETLIEKILADPALLSSLASSPVQDHDHEAALDALREAIPQEAPQESSVDDALASLPEVVSAEETDGSADVLAELAEAAPEDTPADTSLDDALSSLPEAVASLELDTSDEVLSDLAATMPEDVPVDTTLEDALSSIPETTVETSQDEVSADVLSDLADMAPEDTVEDSATDDALASLPEVEVAEDDDDSEDILSGLADAAPEDNEADNALEDALSSLPEAEDIEADDQSDDILSDLADLEPEEGDDESLDEILSSIPETTEAVDEDATDDILASMPEVEDSAEDESSEDILSDLAEAAPEDDTDDDTDLDDLLGELSELAPEDTDEEDAADDILASMPEIENPVEDEGSEDILSDLAEAAPEEDSDDDTDLDVLLGELSELDPDDDEDASNEILEELAEAAPEDEAADQDDLDALLDDLVEETTESEGDDDIDLDDLLGDLTEDVSEDDDQNEDADSSGDDLDDLLADLDLDDELSAKEDDADEEATEEEDTDNLDLDDLLGDLDLDDDTPDDDDVDLDELLADDDTTDEDVVDDLEDLLSDEEAAKVSESDPAPEGAKPSGEPALAFGKMSADRPDPERLKRTRFRIAIFGDFSGRSARGQIETGDALAARKPILLDPDTVEEVIESFATTLVLPIGKDGAGIEVKLKELDDLHPDELYENVELFDGLSGLKGQLNSGATAEHAAKQLTAWGEEFGHAVVPPRKTSGGNTVRADLKLSDFQKLIGDTGGELAQASPVDDLLKRVVGPHIRKLPSPDVSAMQGAVDEALSAAMRMVLHHPEFQSVEAQWRSLDLIARSVEDDDTLDVILYDVSAEEIAADLAAEEDLAKTGLVRLLTDEPLDEENGRGGYSALIGLYTFEETPPHAELLGRIGRVAAHVDAPFISAITPAYLDIKKEDRHPLVVRAWDTFRAMPEAGHVGLASPRFLLRRPYGAKSEPIYEFDFEEFTETEGLRGMLWANPAVLVTILLAQSFKQNGKAMKLGSVMSLGGIPFHFVNDRYGDQVALPCTERNITMEKHEQSVQRGYMPVLSIKGRDEIRLGSFNSVAGQEILGPWSGVPVPEPSPDVPPEPEANDTSDDDDFDLDMELDIEDDGGSDAELDAMLADLEGGDDAADDDDDTDDLDDLLASFGADDSDLGDGSDDDDDEMDPELAALLADL